MTEIRFYIYLKKGWRNFFMNDCNLKKLVIVLKIRLTFFHSYKIDQGIFNLNQLFKACLVQNWSSHLYISQGCSYLGKGHSSLCQGCLFYFLTFESITMHNHKLIFSSTAIMRLRHKNERGKI